MKIRILFVTIAFQITLAAQSVPAQLDLYMERFFSGNPRPGIAVAVVREGRVLLLKGYGTARAGEELPVNGDTPFQLGSVTKSMTSLAALSLEREGLLNLDDPATKVLPWFRTANREKSDGITLRMLLSNSSGIPSAFGNLYKQPDSLEEGLRELGRSLASLSLPSEPGTSYLYSNTGYAIAGLILSEASGLPYEKLMQKTLFRPLGMDRTSAVPEDPELFRNSFGNGWAPEGEAFPLRREALRGGNLEPAGSRCRTTARDMSLYLLYLLSPEAPADDLFQPLISHRGLSREQGGQSEENRYALGFELETIDGRELIYHSGGTGTFSSVLMLDRASSTGVVILSNAGELDPYRYEPLITGANNLLHIAGEEPLSRYGIPLTDNPALPVSPYLPDNREKYSGIYRISAESTESMAPREVVISQKGDRTSAAFYTDQLFSLCRLEFLSASSAAAVSTGPVLPVDFHITLEGDVVTLEAYGARYERYTPPGGSYRAESWGNYRFFLPREWTITGEDTHFLAVSPHSPGLIESGVVPDFTEIASLAESFQGEEAVVYPEQLMGRFYFKQYYRRFRTGSGEKQQLLLHCRAGEEWLYLLVTVPAGELTETVQRVIRPMVTSLGDSLPVP
ncbi:MAG: beta-lactamase family protein [Spirochaetales bacterium]|nr:beta-lactamase family protein [Spirochaetales bacterium]